MRIVGLMQAALKEVNFIERYVGAVNPPLLDN